MGTRFVATGMAQASLSTGSRSHLLHASRDDGQDALAPMLHQAGNEPRVSY
jgi:hypothetical protein